MRNANPYAPRSSICPVAGGAENDGHENAGHVSGV